MRASLPRRPTALVYRAVCLATVVLMAAAIAATTTLAAPGEIPGRGFLPDDRGWEKVSPGPKNGFDVYGYGTRQTSTSGDRAVFGLSHTAPGAAVGGQSTLLANRGAGGWLAHPIDAPEPGSFLKYTNYLAFNDDFSKSVLRSHAKLTPEATEEGPQLYLRDNTAPGGSYELLTPNTIASGFFSSVSLYVGGRSADLSHVVYESNIAQTAAPVTGVMNIYEWVDGAVRLVNLVDPDGPGPDPESAVPTGAVIGAGAERQTYTDSAVSRDGLRIVFHVFEPEDAIASSSLDGQIYVRENGTETIHVSASQRTDCADDPTCGGDGDPDPLPDPVGTQPPQYRDAEAEHGSKVLFTSCEKLTDDSTASTTPATEQLPCTNHDEPNSPEPSDGNDQDLYLYDVESGQLSDLTTGDPSGAEVYGVVETSDDLSRVYFVAGGVLAPGATQHEPNLYLWDEGVTTFIGTLDPGTSFPPEFHTAPVDQYLWVNTSDFSEKPRNVRITPDGDRLLFASRAPQLTSYDNSSSNCLYGRCQQVYLYDAEADELTCVSCDPSGAPPVGDAFPSRRFNAGSGGAARVPPSEPLQGNLTEDGESLFFNTPQRLHSADLNAKHDVYEWSDGELRLISSGTSSSDSWFVDATPDGDDVLFLTRSRLVGADDDDLFDLYDARVGGGFPEPAAAPVPCTDDGCQGDPSSAPGLAEPVSSELRGSGDVAQGPRAAFALSRITAAQRRALARGRKVTIVVRVNRRGRVAAVARARLGGARSRVVGRANAVARRAGAVRLGLRLSPAARGHLARHGSAQVSLAVRFSAGGQARRLTLSLRRPGGAARGGRR